MGRRRRKHRGGGADPMMGAKVRMRQIRWFCQCQYKRRYPDRRSALRECDRMLAQTGERLWPYKCRSPFGRGGAHYHIGHSRRWRLAVRFDFEEMEGGE